MPPGLVRSAAARSSSSCSSGSGCARQRRSGRRASTPSPEHGASTSARSKPRSSSSRTSALTTRTFGPSARRPSRSRARPAMQLDRGDLAVQHRRLAAGRRAGVEHALAFLRADDERGELRRRGSSAACAPSRRRARRTYAPGTSVGSPTGSAARTSSCGRLVLRAHQRERVLRAEVARPDLGDPVGIRLLDRTFRQRRDEAVEALREPAHDGVRERHGALAARRRAPARLRRRRPRARAGRSSASW